MTDNVDQSFAEADLKTHVKDRNTWRRGFFMLLFLVINNIAVWLGYATALFQFLFTLVTGAPNPRLRSFGNGLSRLIHDVMRYLTFNSEEKPFPFSDWPGGQAENEVVRR